MKTSNNYRVSGKKLNSRFGMSVREDRQMTKIYAKYDQSWRGGEYAPAPQPKLSRRKLKTCNHPRMRDYGGGGPESGYIDLRCPDCGYSYHETLY